MKRELDDLENLTIGRADEIRKYVSRLSGVETPSGKTDPINSLGKTLGADIKRKIDELVEEVGNFELLDKHQKVKDIMAGKTIMGIKKPLETAKDVDKVFKTEKISNQLAFNQKLSKEASTQQALSKFGVDVYTPE